MVPTILLPLCPVITVTVELSPQSCVLTLKTSECDIFGTVFTKVIKFKQTLQGVPYPTVSGFLMEKPLDAETGVCRETSLRPEWPISKTRRGASGTNLADTGLKFEPP